MTTSESTHRILVTLEGGVIQALANIPAGVVVEVRDYDDDGDREHQSWNTEHRAFVSVWEGPQAEPTGTMGYHATLDRNGTEDELIIRDLEGRGIASITFWDNDAASRNRAHADARLIVNALNAAHRGPAGSR